MTKQPKSLIRVFPRRTAMTPDDDLAFVGDPPLLRPPADAVGEVHVSCCFYWHVREAVRLYHAWRAVYPSAKVRLGGPVWHRAGGPPEKFTPGRYIARGVTFTSRGCPDHCRFCLVPNWEGQLQEIDIEPGYVIQDNNILATSRAHFRKVCEMLAGQKRRPQFQGGLEAARLSDWHVEKLRGLKLPARNALWFSCDRDGEEGPLTKAIGKLKETAGPKGDAAGKVVDSLKARAKNWTPEQRKQVKKTLRDAGYPSLAEKI